MSERSPSPAGQPALVDRIVEQLEAAILAGALQPGQRVTEQLLAAQFGVGRGPLREAIRTLEGRRLVLRTPYSGVRVASLSIEEFDQLLITREALEGMAARQAAECMTLGEIRRIRASLAEFEEWIRAAGIARAYEEASPDRDFHVQIVRASRNRWLEAFLCRDLYALIRMFRSRSAAVGARSAAATAEHLAILAAIERRDPDEAERLMRAHVATARENLMADVQATGAAGGPQPPEPSRLRRIGGRPSSRG